MNIHSQVLCLWHQCPWSPHSYHLEKKVQDYRSAGPSWQRKGYFAVSVARWPRVSVSHQTHGSRKSDRCSHAVASPLKLPLQLKPGVAKALTPPPPCDRGAGPTASCPGAGTDEAEIQGVVPGTAPHPGAGTGLECVSF